MATTGSDGYFFSGLCQLFKFLCFARAIANSLSATSFVTTEPAPTESATPTTESATTPTKPAAAGSQ